MLTCTEGVVLGLIWIWKAAPVALYETFMRDLSCFEKAPGRRYLYGWWQKLLATWAALGFYYILYQFVCQPFLFMVHCCGSETRTDLMAALILLLHLLSGISMHRYSLRQEELESHGIDRRYAPSQSQSQLPQLDMSGFNIFASTTDWVAIDDGDLPATGISTSNLPPLQETPQPVGAPHVPVHVLPTETQSSGFFWPFRKKHTPQQLTNSKDPHYPIV